MSPKSKREDLPHVVVVGGGFAGLHATRHLYKAPVRITVVDRHNHHLFQPLLYQVATATLSPSEIAAPLRAVLGHRKVEVVLAEVTGVDTAGKRVLLADGELKYDYLVIATGATHSYFGNDAWAHFAPGLKSIEDAVEIRRRILVAFELAEREQDPVLRRALLNFVIIGAGPTGVELAGSLAEISRHSLPGDFRHIDPSEARIILIEGMDRVLPVYPDDLSLKAQRTLEKLGVEVHTGARVTNINEQGIFIGADFIPARTVLWAAGVAASPVARSLGVKLDRAGRVLVTPELTVPGCDDVFVVGDLASLKGADGKPVPGLAPAAMQEGKHAAHNICLRLRGKPMEPFSYWDRGSYAVIGRGHAVGIAFRRFKQWGFGAWMAWLLIHITFLIGFRSRLVVLLDWAYSYLTFGKSARIITGPTPRLDRLPASPALPEGGEDSAIPESRFQATASRAAPPTPVPQ